jgi:hypothetical protein
MTKKLVSRKPLSSDSFSKRYLILPDDLSREEESWFWEQGVNMDDWDRMLICPAKTIYKYQLPLGATEGNEEGWRWEADDYNLNAALDGNCDFEWYKVKFKDGWRAVGVSYHA